MSKLKKLIITIAVCVVIGALLGVALVFLTRPEKLPTEPKIKATLNGDVIEITGLDAELEYKYSSDGVKWTDVKDTDTLTLDKGKTYQIKEVLGENESEITYVGPYAETMKYGRPFIVDEVEAADMNSITVHNTEDEYSLIHKKSGAYKIEGLDGYEVNQQLLSMLRVNSLHLLAVSHVEDAELDNTEQYGISKTDPKIWFRVVYNNEKDSYRILIGDKTPDGNGYYAMLEGRDALYIIDTGVESCILLPRKAYVTPTLVDTVEDNYVYTLKDFTLNKNGKKFISIEKASGELTYGNNASHRLTYPAYNYATSLANFEMLLSAIKSISGSETLYYGENITDELLRELGFFDGEGNDVSDYSFTYSYPQFSELVYVMNDEENDCYTVYSLKENLIARVAKESLAFLEWDMLLWVSAEIYMLDIEDIASVEYTYGSKTATFTLSGEGESLTVVGNGMPIDTLSFKELYKSIMYILVTAYTEDSDYGNEQLRMVITTEKGEELEYVFYTHSATNSYYTLNGFGEFYVSADKILEMRDVAFGLVK